MLAMISRAAIVLAAATQPAPPVWLVLLAIAGMWLLGSIVLAFASGHMALLARFPPVEEPEESFSFASGTMRLVSYNNALRVGIGRRGLHLAAGWLFRPVTHRQIPCIPWSEIRCVKTQAQSSWFTRASQFEIPRLGLRFRIAGKPGLAVERALQAIAPAGAAS